jgi:hypothetical protein
MSSVVFSVRRRDLVWATVLAVLLSAVWVARSDVAGAGAQPPGEGIAVVYVAVGSNFPDSLGVGPGGGVNGAPIIIVPTNPPIPAVTAAELMRLDPKKVIIVGGTAVISASMETAIGSLLPNATVERIAGANRYETNAMFSEATFPVEAWVSIPTAAFTAPAPYAQNVTIGLTAVWNGSNGGLLAPVQLPHGAEILELKVAGFDTDAGQNLTVILYRVNTSAFSNLLAVTGSSGTPGSFVVSSTLITAGLGIVDNENYNYQVEVAGPDGNPWVRSVMVRYRLGAPGG